MEMHPVFLMIFLRTNPLSHSCFNALKLTYCSIYWFIYNHILFVFSCNVLRYWQIYLSRIWISFIWFRGHQMNYDMHHKHVYFKFLAWIGCTLFIFFQISWKKIIGQVPKKCTKLSHPPLQFCPRFLILLTTLVWGRQKNFLLSGYIVSMIKIWPIIFLLTRELSISYDSFWYLKTWTLFFLILNFTMKLQLLYFYFNLHFPSENHFFSERRSEHWLFSIVPAKMCNWKIHEHVLL